MTLEPPTYEIRLMFEWRGSCLWGMNQAAKDRFGYDDLERLLPLSAITKATLKELSELHDTALDWANPGGPSLWLPEQFDAFELKAQAVLSAVQAELGSEYLVWYSRLGGTAEQ